MTKLAFSTVAETLKVGGVVTPQSFKCATVLFTDIVQFTNKCAMLTPLEVVTMLNSVYSQFDATIAASDAYKVETAGDSYLVVSGVPTENGNKHADALATVAVTMLEVLSFA